MVRTESQLDSFALIGHTAFDETANDYIMLPPLLSSEQWREPGVHFMWCHRLSALAYAHDGFAGKSSGQAA